PTAVENGPPAVLRKDPPPLGWALYSLRLRGRSVQKTAGALLGTFRGRTRLLPRLSVDGDGAPTDRNVIDDARHARNPPDIRLSASLLIRPLDFARQKHISIM